MDAKTLYISLETYRDYIYLYETTLVIVHWLRTCPVIIIVIIILVDRSCDYINVTLLKIFYHMHNTT